MPIFCRPTKNIHVSATVWWIQTSLRQDWGLVLDLKTSCRALSASVPSWFWMTRHPASTGLVRTKNRRVCGSFKLQLHTRVSRKCQVPVRKRLESALIHFVIFVFYLHVRKWLIDRLINSASINMERANQNQINQADPWQRTQTIY